MSCNYDFKSYNIFVLFSFLMETLNDKQYVHHQASLKHHHQS